MKDEEKKIKKQEEKQAAKRKRSEDRVWRKRRRIKRRCKRREKRVERRNKIKCWLEKHSPSRLLAKAKSKREKRRLRRVREEERARLAEERRTGHHCKHPRLRRLKRKILALWRKVKNLHKADVRHWVLLGVLAASVTLFFTKYLLTFERVGSALHDLKNAVVFYFVKISGGEYAGEISVNVMPDVDLRRVCPFDLDDFLRKCSIFGQELFTKEMFLKYVQATVRFIHDAAFYLVMFLPLLIALGMLIYTVIMAARKSHKDTKALRAWYKVRPYFKRVFTWLRGLWDFSKKHTWSTLLAIVWFFNLNVITIGIEFFSWYFTFAAQGLAFEGLSVNILRLLMDVLIMLWSLPWPLWAVIGWIVFDDFRRNIGYNVLRAHEAVNVFFFEILAVAVLIVGTMGKGKTTLLTDLGLTGQNFFRKKMRSLMFAIDMSFPNFPWQRFEDTIDELHAKGIIHKRRHVREYIRKRREQYEKCPTAHLLWGYDVKYEAMGFDNALTVRSLWDALEAYGALYFYYTIESPLLSGNYSVRSDAYLTDKGNFPLWKDDFFQNSTEESAARTQYSHVLDQDTLRLNKLMQPNNPLYGSKDVGIDLITEKGKERGNMLDHKAFKSTSEDTNPTNDGYDKRTKMRRHMALFENVNLTKEIGDEQREESLGADAREIGDIVKIVERSDRLLAMPFYTFGKLLDALFSKRFNDWYYACRVKRGDRSLTLHVIKNAFCLFYQRHIRIMNTFGYRKLLLALNDGKEESEPVFFEYYISDLKTYRDRFRSDGFGDAFEEESKLTELGLEDVPQFESLTSTVKNMSNMHSYFANLLIEKVMHVDEDEEKNKEES